MRSRYRPHHSPRERGAVLFVSLILLLILTLIGITAARMQTAEERMAQNDDNHQLAFQNAEAALRDVELQVEDGQSQFASASADAGTAGVWDLFNELNGAGPSVLGGSGSVADLSPSEFQTSGIALAYSGPTLSSVPVHAPDFTVESFPVVSIPGNPMCGANYPATACTANRITTVATGGDSGSTVTLQSIVY